MKGKGASEALEWICANKVARGPGRLTYSQLLNTRGGIECDLTVAQLADDDFYIVTGTGFRTHDFAWIADHIRPGLDARLVDVTEGWGTLSLMGPKSRGILAKVTAADVSNGAFPFGHVREIEIAGCKLRALRVTYVGTGLGASHSHRCDRRGLRCADGGGRGDARRQLGAEIAPGSRRATAPGGPTSRRTALPFRPRLGGEAQVETQDFIGRAACERMAAEPLSKMLAGFTTERDDIVLLGRETILRNGVFAGYLTSGGYGYTAGKPIGYGYVRNEKGVDQDYVRFRFLRTCRGQERGEG